MEFSDILSPDKDSISLLLLFARFNTPVLKAQSK